LNFSKQIPSERSPKDISEQIRPRAVFMSEGESLVMGEAILSRALATTRSNDELIEDLVRQHSQLVYRIAYAALRNHHESEDATQETFLRVLRYGRKLATVQDHKAWLARTAWRVAVDRSQRVGSRREVPIEAPITDSEKLAAEIRSIGPTADDTVHCSEVSMQLERLIPALPRKLREPLILSAVEEMSPREVAAALGINEAAARSRVFRARQILREKLAANAGWKQR
jgi:RNA polymerase sigma-70 factor (ECF subfamily)